MARTIYVRCTYGIFGREIAKFTVHIQYSHIQCIYTNLANPIDMHVQSLYHCDCYIHVCKNPLQTFAVVTAPFSHATFSHALCYMLHIGLARTVYIRRTLRIIPAIKTVCTAYVYVYGSGQPYICYTVSNTVLANPTYAIQ